MKKIWNKIYKNILIKLIANNKMRTINKKNKTINISRFMN